MKKFSTYLVVMFMVIFWIVRILVTLGFQFGKDFMGMIPMNETFEIAILFATLICLILVVKRKLVGGLLYLTLHAIYYGGDITSKLGVLSRGDSLTFNENVQLIFSMLGIILALVVLMDLLLDHNRKLNPKDKKTDWFYQNEQFDRELDERTDKNNYRIM